IETAEQQIQDLAALADAGETAGALAHEVNDFLNVLLLQLAILEQKSSPEDQGKLVEVRRQGKQLGELVKHWQRSRAGAGEGRPIDLNRLLQHVDLGTGDVLVRMEVAPHLPCILGVPSDVRRLCTFLVKNAISAAQQGQKQVLVRTEAANGSVRLRVEDTGPTVSQELLAQLFEASFDGRPGTDRLELAACRSIVQRLHSKIRAEKRPGGGVAVVVDFPTA